MKRTAKRTRTAGTAPRKPGVLMTFEAKGTAPTIQSAARKLGVAPTALDADFGVLAIDPDRGMFTVRVMDEAAVQRSAVRTGVGGPFSNPRIAPFGRTRSR